MIREKMRCKTKTFLLDVSYFVVQLHLTTIVCAQDYPLLKIGCFEDRITRDLGNLTKSSSNTPSDCLKRCSGLGFAFASLQNGDECRCDNKYGLYGRKPDIECSVTCTGDPALKCGGSWRNAVYCLVPFYDKFRGCYKESVPRDLWGLETTASTNRCLQICQSSGYAYAAVQNDSRCTCGVSYGRYGKADPFTCSCSKNSNAVYQTGGTWKMVELFYGNIPQISALASRYLVYTESSVDNLYLCISYCERNELCKSINYNYVTRTCEMNNVTSLEGESQARQGFQYYEPVGNIFSHQKLGDL